MQPLTITLLIVHAVVSLALVIIVLLQQGKQEGLSGAIAGGAETFFGKNKARTIDSMLKKFTTVVAALFIISSIGLYVAFAPPREQQQQQQPPGGDEMQAMIIGHVDEDGNLIDEASGEIMEGYFIDADGTVIGEDGQPAIGLSVDANGNIWFDMSAFFAPDVDLSGLLEGLEITHDGDDIPVDIQVEQPQP